jgi:hypothetical protein
MANKSRNPANLVAGGGGRGVLLTVSLRKFMLRGSTLNGGDPSHIRGRSTGRDRAKEGERKKKKQIFPISDERWRAYVI